MSRSIQALEEGLAIQLIYRTGQGAALTAAGSIIVERACVRACRVLFETRYLVRDAELVKRHELGEVSFGVGPYLAVIFLSDVLASLKNRHPKMTIHTEVNNWDTLLAKLCAGAIDFLAADERAIPRSTAITIRKLPLHHAALLVRAGIRC